MRLIYLGSPSDAIFPLQFLLEHSKHDVIAVITQPAKKKGGKQNFRNKNNRSKSSGVRKVGRGG